MNPTSVIALFCDDIREEKSGALTLVGVLGDNVRLPPLPDAPDKLVGMIPRLCVYTRISFDVSAELGPITIKLTMPDGTEVDGGGIDEQTITNAKNTREQGNPIAGVISRIQFGGIVMKKMGRLTVNVTIGAVTYIAGVLNFVPEMAESNP
jgi:hypothetical protein